MSTFSYIPLLYIGNSTTNSGIVNKHGFISFDTCTTFSGTMNYFLSNEVTLLTQSNVNTSKICYAKQDSNSLPTLNILNAPNISNAVPAFATGPNAARHYLQSTPKINGLNSLLSYCFGLILDTKNRDLAAIIQVVSIENLAGFIVGTTQEITELTSFIRPFIEESQLFYADILAKSNYVLKQILTKNNFVYAAVGMGIQIFDINTNASLYLKEILGYRINNIWGNTTDLYYGGQGKLLTISYNTLHNNFSTSQISESFLLGSETINYIHGYNKSLLIATDIGVEYINWESENIIRSSTNILNVNKCFLTRNAAYYSTNTTISGIIHATLYVQKYLQEDWNNAYKQYDYTLFKENVSITDIFVTEDTASNGYDTIFCSTTNGIFAIDEYTDKKAIYYKR